MGHTHMLWPIQTGCGDYTHECWTMHTDCVMYTPLEGTPISFGLNCYINVWVRHTGCELYMLVMDHTHML